MYRPLYYEHLRPTRWCHRIPETQSLWGTRGLIAETLCHPPKGVIPPASTWILPGQPSLRCMGLAILLLISSTLKICPKLSLHLTSTRLWQNTVSCFFSLWLGGDWILMLIYGAEYFTVSNNGSVFRQINTTNSLSLRNIHKAPICGGLIALHL